MFIIAKHVQHSPSVTRPALLAMSGDLERFDVGWEERPLHGLVFASADSRGYLIF